MGKHQFTLRRLLVWMALLAVPLTAAGYFVRWYASFAEGDRAMARVASKVENLGGEFGLDDEGTYYVAPRRPFTDADLADLAVDLRAAPPPWRNRRHDIALSLFSTDITDQGLQHLHGIRLRIVWLPPQITDAAIPTLKSLHLHECVLEVNYTLISYEGARELEKDFAEVRDHLRGTP